MEHLEIKIPSDIYEHLEEITPEHVKPHARASQIVRQHLRKTKNTPDNQSSKNQKNPNEKTTQQKPQQNTDIEEITNQLEKIQNQTETIKKLNYIYSNYVGAIYIKTMLQQPSVSPKNLLREGEINLEKVEDLEKPNQAVNPEQLLNLNDEMAEKTVSLATSKIDEPNALDTKTKNPNEEKHITQAVKTDLSDKHENQTTEKTPPEKPETESNPQTKTKNPHQENEETKNQTLKNEDRPFKQNNHNNTNQDTAETKTQNNENTSPNNLTTKNQKHSKKWTLPPERKQKIENTAKIHKPEVDDIIESDETPDKTKNNDDERPPVEKRFWYRPKGEENASS